MEGARTIEFRANGIDFVAFERGEGPLVLCLHGFPDNARTFRHQIGPLSEAGYRVVSPFMRGYAPTSPAPDGYYQTAALGRDAIGMIDALGADKAVVIGHDWGAMAAYAAALEAPERLNKLVTFALPFGPTFLDRFTTSYDQLKRSWYVFYVQTVLADVALPRNDFEFVRRLWGDWSPGWEPEAGVLDDVAETLGKPGVLEAVLGYYRWMFDPSKQDPSLAEEQARQDVTPISVPSLVMHGARDGCMGVELGDAMETEGLFTAGLARIVVDGAGHFLHQEKPDEVNRAILEFLAK